jgi:hypothetical protein
VDKDRRMLNERLMYLNKLRVDVGRSYVIAAAAIIAFATRLGDAELATLFKVVGFPAFILGFAVLLFDIKNCARAGAVAAAIREMVSGGTSKEPRGLLGRLSEDACFGMTISAINSFVLVATIAAFGLNEFKSVQLDAQTIANGIMLFVAAFALQTWFWINRVGKWQGSMDALPVGGAYYRKADENNDGQL